MTISDARDHVLEIYHRHGVAWAASRGDDLIEAQWLDRFIALLPAGADVLDIGCGSGMPLARALTDHGFHVTGVDGALTMLDLFRRNLPDSACHLADMRQLDLDRRFAGLLAWDSLFHLSPDDQRGMFPRFAAHALPGAALMFTSGPSYGHAIGALEGDPLFHGSLDPKEYRALLDAAGFAVVSHIANDPTCGAHTVWLARRRD